MRTSNYAYLQTIDRSHIRGSIAGALIIARAIAVLLVVMLVQPARTFAFDSEAVHPLIGEQAYANSRLMTYFRDRLSINLTLATSTFSGRLAVQHMQDGGTAEDNGMRAWNHFHDPLRLWDRAGYEGGRSNAVWAQDQTDWVPTHTWGDALRDFRHALTDEGAAAREARFADFFQTLGRLTHLVADLAVPEHVRNDGHLWTPLYSHYEEWCKQTLTELDIPARLDPAHPDNGQPYFRNLYGPARDLFAQDRAPNLSPVSNLWDAHVVSGYNPSLRVAIGTGKLSLTAVDLPRFGGHIEKHLR